MHEFKVGDRVRIREHVDGEVHIIEAVTTLELLGQNYRVYKLINLINLFQCHSLILVEAAKVQTPVG